MSAALDKRKRRHLASTAVLMSSPADSTSLPYWRIPFADQEPPTLAELLADHEVPLFVCDSEEQRQEASRDGLCAVLRGESLVGVPVDGRRIYGTPVLREKGCATWTELDPADIGMPPDLDTSRRADEIAEFIFELARPRSRR